MNEIINKLKNDGIVILPWKMSEQELIDINNYV